MWMMLLSCGARSEIPFEDPGGDEPAESASLPSPGSAREPPRGSDPSIIRSGQLPACVEGTPVSDAPSCAFLADSLCYETSREACACACSRARESTCVEGLFANEHGGVDVTCY